jgi:hypothetical protein
MNTTTKPETAALQESNQQPQTALVETSRQQAGALMLDGSTMDSLLRVADMMATGKSTVPAHLQKNPSDCLAVCMQAMQWGMNPFAVAQKTHLVNGTLGYEAQLVNAVVQQSGAIEGRFHYEYKGDSPSLQCRVGAVIRGEKDITWGNWLSENKVTTKNSPLWKTNPQQQMGYLQVKNWARLFTPGAILGVYTPEELADIPGNRFMGNADVVGETVDVGPYLVGARATKTDAEAAAYWKEHNSKFAKQPDDHQTFKDVVINHRKAMKAATTVDQETGEITQKPAAAAPAQRNTDKPKVTYESVLEMINAAKNEDALNIAMDWANELTDAEQVKALGARYDELLAAMRGAA